MIKTTSFVMSDQLDTSRSSWIRGASYYGCNTNTGFLLIRTDSSSYLHQGVPLEVWKGFKTANSFGSYYNNNIKGRYQLHLD